MAQVFDCNGNFMKEFGSYGSGEGEFDCLAGVAVNRIGQYIIADRYNHRIQVLDPSGRFLRAFGSQGTADGRFNYPWGITTDALGFIYVCDKENHRVQVRGLASILSIFIYLFIIIRTIGLAKSKEEYTKQRRRDDTNRAPLERSVAIYGQDFTSPVFYCEHTIMIQI